MLFAPGGAKVGGWNKRWGHRYLSKAIAEGRDALMHRYGFKFGGRTADCHCGWQMKGADRADAFHCACGALTGERVSPSGPEL